MFHLVIIEKNTETMFVSAIWPTLQDLDKVVHSYLWEGTTVEVYYENTAELEDKDKKRNKHENAIKTPKKNETELYKVGRDCRLGG